MTNRYKKEWVGPKLIVLTRSRPEEVLTGDCKHPGTPVGANRLNYECQLEANGCKRCFSQNNKS